jgi:hypothetical protein
MVLAVWMAMMLAACAPSGRPPVERALPPPPEFLRPVPLPAIEPGADARLVAAQNRAAAVRANRRLSDTADWYAVVRSRHAAGGAR